MSKVEKGAVTKATEYVFSQGLRVLLSAGSKEQSARAILGKARKVLGDIELADVLRRAEKMVDPIGYVMAVVHKNRSPEAVRLTKNDSDRLWAADLTRMGDAIIRDDALDVRRQVHQTMERDRPGNHAKNVVRDAEIVHARGNTKGDQFGAQKRQERAADPPGIPRALPLKF